MILAQRILDCLRDNGPIAVRDLPHYLRDVDNIDLDTTVNRLMRQNSVSLTLGRYDLVAQKPNGHAPFIATPASEPPPSAVEEAAKSLTPQLFHCDACPDPHPDEAFRHRADGTRYSVCKMSHARKMGSANRGRKSDSTVLAGDRVAITTEDSRSVRGESSGPGCLPPANGSSDVDADTLRRHKSQLGCRDGVEQSTCGGDLLASAAEPGTSDGAIPSAASAAHRLGPMSLTETQPVQPRPAATFNSPHTPPARQVGSSEPPVTSSDTSSATPAHGTTLTGVLAEEPEALSSVGGELPRFELRFEPDSPEVFFQSLPGARGPVSLVLSGNSVPDDPLSLLARKRAELIARRELLLEEYESRLRPVLEKIDAMDQVMEHARRLCEETE